MTIYNYIRNHKELSQFDISLVYEVIIALIQDGKLDWPPDSV